MDRFDLVIIGAGPAGEAAAFTARALGASVAIVDRDLFGGACPFWACMPSKSLLHSAAVHAAGGDYPWPTASKRRDWMISREGIDYPSDGGHVRNLEAAGADLVRGEARIVGPGKVEVRTNGENPRTLEGRNLVMSTGSVPVIPPVEGLDEAGYWTSREATSTRELPSSIVIMGGGPVGTAVTDHSGHWAGVSVPGAGTYVASVTEEVRGGYQGADCLAGSSHQFTVQ